MFVGLCVCMRVDLYRSVCLYACRFVGVYVRRLVCLFFSKFVRVSNCVSVCL